MNMFHSFINFVDRLAIVMEVARLSNEQNPLSPDCVAHVRELMLHTPAELPTRHRARADLQIASASRQAA